MNPLKSITQEELQVVLANHKKWLNGEEGGIRADLSHTDLRYANLQDADLRRANLQNADLRYANLRNADLQNANLQCAILQEANLRYAYLLEANLQDADLQWADLQCTSLLRANLQYAYLRYANLKDAYLPDFQLCPQEGSFVGYKKVEGGVTLTLEILGDRTSSLIGRSCRTSKAKVLKAEKGGVEVQGVFKSKFDPTFAYAVGEVVEEPGYDSDIRIECTSGIHFYMTKREALQF